MSMYDADEQLFHQCFTVDSEYSRTIGDDLGHDCNVPLAFQPKA